MSRRYRDGLGVWVLGARLGFLQRLLLLLKQLLQLFNLLFQLLDSLGVLLERRLAAAYTTSTFSTGVHIDLQAICAAGAIGCCGINRGGNALTAGYSGRIANIDEHCHRSDAERVLTASA